MASRAVAVAVMVLTIGCVTTGEPVPVAPAPPAPPVLSVSDVKAHLPNDVTDREGWATDIIAAITATGKTPTAERVCAVIAIVGQESGFVADPPVAKLPALVRAGVLDKLSPLGVLAEPTLIALLQVSLADGATVSSRVDALRTEHDLDRLFRDIAAAMQRKHPTSFVLAQALAMGAGKGSIDDLNPVTTAGSMQVKVAFAREHGRSEGRSDVESRELLYTRAGGVRYGTLRLIGYPASYVDISHRFADYNAGMYSSRNAEFQRLLADLTGAPLVLDGDLLSYRDDGDVSGVDSKSLQAMLRFGAEHGLSERHVRRDAALEKSVSFETTPLWSAVRAAWQQQMGTPPAYARLPTVSLSSPKLSKPRTTAWFADAVKRRYTACRAR
jgi:hypothetical protein